MDWLLLPAHTAAAAAAVPLVPVWLGLGVAGLVPGLTQGLVVAVVTPGLHRTGGGWGSAWDAAAFAALAELLFFFLRPLHSSLYV